MVFIVLVINHNQSNNYRQCVILKLLLAFSKAPFVGTQPGKTTKTVKFVGLTLICLSEHSLLCLLKMYEKVRKFWIGGCVEAGILSAPSTPRAENKAIF